MSSNGAFPIAMTGRLPVTRLGQGALNSDCPGTQHRKQHLVEGRYLAEGGRGGTWLRGGICMSLGRQTA